jgi:hypothetical protein
MSTLAQLQEDLTAARAERLRILTGAQSYSVKGKSTQRASLKDINELIRDLESQISDFNGYRSYQADFSEGLQ